MKNIIKILPIYRYHYMVTTMYDIKSNKYNCCGYSTDGNLYVIDKITYEIYTNFYYKLQSLINKYYAEIF